MGRYAVRLDDISFSYEDHRVIRNLSLGAESGEHIGIVGESGCGKTALKGKNNSHKSCRK